MHLVIYTVEGIAIPDSEDHFVSLLGNILDIHSAISELLERVEVSIPFVDSDHCHMRRE